MSSQQSLSDLVREFREMRDLPGAEKLHIPSRGRYNLQTSLLAEAVNELQVAFENKDVGDAATSMANILLFVLNTALICGFDIETFFRIRHEQVMRDEPQNMIAEIMRQVEGRRIDV